MGFKMVILAAVVLAANQAPAQVPALEPLHHTARYDVSWNGFPVGRVRITAHEDRFAYSMTVDTKTRGLVDLFAESTSLAQVKGRVQDGEYIPGLYDSRSRSSKERVVTIRYDADGDIKDRTRTPMDDPAWRPIVPLEEANTATDPITAFFMGRKRLHGNIANNIRQTQVRTYEGARLALFTAEVISRSSLTIMDRSMNAINIVPQRTLLNGYTPKEIKKHEQGDPTVHVYFSADGLFIPVLAEMKLGLGTLKAELTELTAD